MVQRNRRVKLFAGVKRYEILWNRNDVHEAVAASSSIIIMEVREHSRDAWSQYLLRFMDLDRLKGPDVFLRYYISEVRRFLRDS